MLLTSRVTIPLMVLIAVGVGVSGAYYQYQLQSGGASLLAQKDTEETTSSFAPVTTPPASPTALARVEGVTNTQVAATPQEVPSPVASPTPAAPTSDTDDITFIDLPSSVRAGEKFTVRWRVGGPEGAAGGDTKLTVVYKASSSEGNAHSSVNSNTSTSFGSFTVPATFSSTFSLGQHPGPVVITVTADVDGRTLREERTITLQQ